MRVLQAIYGEVQKGHDLLAASPAKPDESPVFNRVRLLTGLIDNPPTGIGWQPYLRGFTDGEYYVLTRVFPDPSAPRQDMVFTHALFLPLDTFCRAGDLAHAMSHLATCINKSMPLPMLEIPDGASLPGAASVTNTLKRNDGRYAALVEALVNPENLRPPVWVGQEGFDVAVAALWENLPSDLRRSFAFSLVFAKSNLEGRNFTVVVTPDDCASYWPGGYRLIRANDRGGVVTPPAGYLLGRPEGEPIKSLEALLERPVNDFDSLQRLSLIAAFLKEAEEGVAGATLDAVRQIGSFVPDPMRASAFKTRLLSRLTDETATAGRSAVWGLRNLPLAPFADGEDCLKRAIRGWVGNAVTRLSRGADPDTLKTVTEALSSDSPRQNPQWKQLFVEAITDVFGTWRTEYAATLWNLWRFEPTTISLLAPLLPHRAAVEAALVAALSSGLGPAVGKQVLALCRRMGWYLLHAATSVSFLAPEEAISAHLDFDRRVANIAALDILTHSLADEVVVRSAVAANDGRLYRIAATRAVCRPELLGECDLRIGGWRTLLFYSLEAGLPLPSFGLSVADIIFGLFDLLVSGVHVEVELLRSLSLNPRCADLSDYADRDYALARMPSDVRATFVRVTADSWMRKFEHEPSSASPVNGMVKECVTSKDSVREWLRTSRATPERVVAFFRLFDAGIGVADESLAEWIRALGPVSTLQAVTIGELIGERRWRDSASALATGATQDKNWGAGLPSCRSLLNVGTRIQLAFSGIDEGVSADDWWEAWFEAACRLFPAGVEDSRIWSIADGDISQINTNESGRNQWFDAFNLLRKAKARHKITVPGLLHRMRREYPDDRDLLRVELMWLDGKVKESGP